MDPDLDSALRDLDYGRWIGRSFEEIHRSEPQGIADWLADPNATPHGGESIRELVDRMAIWMNARLGEGGHWIAVTHPSVIRAMIMATLGAPPSAYWHIDIQHLGVADIRSDGTRFALRSLGRLD